MIGQDILTEKVESMDYFAKVHFSGRFRDYQQRVLDNADDYLKDGKINIVAAPGSGKTVLGLELIRRLNSPCIILSPTTAIRQQWGERFRDLFLDDKDDFSDLFSTDLRKIRPVNSATYQALYSATEKVAADPKDEEATADDYSDIDLIDVMRRFGIKTICLDEAHHLRNEWQKALEKFVRSLDKDVKIISLTATPPYDAEGSEWARYKEICGEIDEEIFVPELVGQNTLCPHQDYVYFNFPTEAEAQSFFRHKEQAEKALEELGKLEIFSRLCAVLNGEKDYDALFSDAKGYVALATLLRRFGLIPDKKLVDALTAKKGLPPFKIKYAETALQFLIGGNLITDEEKEQMVSVLKTYSVFEKGKVTLDLDEKLKRTLISSVGKLESIKSIVKSEVETMKNRLRMLILTDYIKKESLLNATSSEHFSSVNVVSIFETLRRENFGADLGVLSGSLVILPESAIDGSETEGLPDFVKKTKKIDGTDYCVIEYFGATHRVVNYVGRLFEQGKIQILIGTKSLLGEGWDSPCINSLILASFVGSFVLSNQMRGRAIRIDKNDADKTANIWHLVTLEPEYLFKDKLTDKISAYLAENRNEIHSCDYEILKRRFDTFMGPNYSTGVIESGIERITVIKPPFDEKGIARINEETLALSGKRGEVRRKWSAEVAGGKFAVCAEEDVQREAKVPVFGFFNYALLTFLTAAGAGLIAGIANVFRHGADVYMLFLLLTVTTVIGILVFKLSTKLIVHLNPARSIRTLGKAVYLTLTECGLVSESAKVETTEHKELLYVSLRLRNASMHDQNVFNTAMAELLSPIENPRYVLVAKNVFKRFNYTLSFACPTVIGKKKEFADVLAKKLKDTTGNFEAVFTRTENGRNLILKCRKNSYITVNERLSGKKFRVSHWE